MEDKNIARLIQVGFEEAGEWFIKDNVLRYRLTQNDQASKILYAFVTDEQVLYIGKSNRTLAQRLNDYTNPHPTQNTNIKNHQYIKDLLRQGKAVKILVFAPADDEIIYRGVPLNLAAGLEDGLINVFQPLWNIQGKE